MHKKGGHGKTEGESARCSCNVSISWSHQKLEEGRRDCSLELSEEARPCRNPDQLLDSRIVRGYFSVVFGNLPWQSEEINTFPFVPKEPGDSDSWLWLLVGEFPLGDQGF